MSQLHKWENVSLDSVKDTHPVLPLIGSLLAGVAILVSTSSTPAAGLAALSGCSFSISRAMRSAKQYDSIRTYGCYSISLDETLLGEYIEFNGLEHTKAEIVWAQSQNLLISSACEDLIDGTTEALPQRIAPSTPQVNSQSQPSPLSAQVSPSQPKIDQPSPLSAQTVPLSAQAVPLSAQANPLPPQFDLIGEMSKSPENTLIIAPSESGKGIVIGNLIAAFKATYDCSVTAIDPKGADTEGGFFAQCDRVHRFKSQQLERDAIVSETKKGWKMFEEECNKWAGIKPCIILIDEMLVIGGCFSKAKDTFLQDKIASLVSMGRSQRQFCWIATQYPQLDKLGIDGGIAGQMELLMIVRQKNISLVKGWVKYDLTKMIKFEDAVSNCEDSPVKRAVYYRDSWYPMPVMENYSGYDRETNKWVDVTPQDTSATARLEAEGTTARLEANTPTDTPASAKADTTARLEAPKADARQMLEKLYNLEAPTASATADTTARLEALPTARLEALENALMDFFQGARNLNPKAVRDCRKANRIASTKATNEEILECLERLTSEGTLIKTNKGYSLPAWEVEDLN